MNKKRLLTALVTILGLGAMGLVAAAPASAVNYSPRCGSVTVNNWSAKNSGCSKQIRHVNYVKNDGYKYHKFVSKGSTSSAMICYARATNSYFQESGSNGLTGYAF